MVDIWLSKVQVNSSLQLWFDRVLYELKTMDSQTSTSLIVFSCTLISVLLVSVYYTWKLERLMALTDDILDRLRDQMEAKEAKQAYLIYLLRLARSTGDSMNMAMYMSEMRRKSKIRRPTRPTELEDRAPELLPGLRARRCQKDGIAVLEIKEDNGVTKETGCNSNEIPSMKELQDSSLGGGESSNRKVIQPPKLSQEKKLPLNENLKSLLKN